MHQPVSSEVRAMFSSIAPKYDITNFALSFGTHHLWKMSFIKRIPISAASSVMDLACGTGDLVPLLKKRFAKDSSKVTGVDFCEPMLEVARTRFPEEQFVVGDALNLSFPDNHFDVVTVSFGVRNFEDLDKGLAEIHRVLKPGGVIAILEFGQPSNLIFRSLYQFYSKYIMPVIGGVLTGNKKAYEYLPQTAAAFPCAGNFIDRMDSVGFKKCCFDSYTLGIAYGYYGFKL
jgi:demethylmenaquinone methyltransferase/2-methoxy-6-polyprenyl-1,4-benzoquinol methylase